MCVCVCVRQINWGKGKTQGLYMHNIPIKNEQVSVKTSSNIKWQYMVEIKTRASTIISNSKKWDC